MGFIIVSGKDLPSVARFDKNDIQLYQDLTTVFAKYGLKGNILRLKFDCGTELPQLPKRRCFRVCVPGPDDRPICEWVCY